MCLTGIESRSPASISPAKGPQRVRPRASTRRDEAEPLVGQQGLPGAGLSRRAPEAVADAEHRTPRPRRSGPPPPSPARTWRLRRHGDSRRRRIPRDDHAVGPAGPSSCQRSRASPTRRAALSASRPSQEPGKLSTSITTAETPPVPGRAPRRARTISKSPDQRVGKQLLVEGVEFRRIVGLELTSRPTGRRGCPRSRAPAAPAPPPCPEDRGCPPGLDQDLGLHQISVPSSTAASSASRPGRPVATPT